MILSGGNRPRRRGRRRTRRRPGGQPGHCARGPRSTPEPSPLNRTVMVRSFAEQIRADVAGAGDGSTWFAGRPAFATGVRPKRSASWAPARRRRERQGQRPRAPYAARGLRHGFPAAGHRFTPRVMPPGCRFRSRGGAFRAERLQHFAIVLAQRPAVGGESLPAFSTAGFGFSEAPHRAETVVRDVDDHPARPQVGIFPALRRWSAPVRTARLCAAGARSAASAREPREARRQLGDELGPMRHPVGVGGVARAALEGRIASMAVAETASTAARCRLRPRPDRPRPRSFSYGVSV